MSRYIVAREDRLAKADVAIAIAREIESRGTSRSGGVPRKMFQLINDILAGENYEVCRRMAEAARSAGFDGLLAPSGALEGETTFVVFAEAIRAGKVSEERSRIGAPPRRMLAYLRTIGVRGAAASKVRRLYRKLVRQLE